MCVLDDFYILLQKPVISTKDCMPQHQAIPTIIVRSCLYIRLVLSPVTNLHTWLTDCISTVTNLHFVADPCSIQTHFHPQYYKKLVITVTIRSQTLVFSSKTHPQVYHFQLNHKAALDASNVCNFFRSSENERAYTHVRRAGLLGQWPGKATLEMLTLHK